MEELKNNKLVWIVAIMLCFNVFGLLMTKVVANIAADKAIEKLQMEYSPAKPPYGPGLNPDRIQMRRPMRPQARNYPEDRRYNENRRYTENRRPYNALEHRSDYGPARDALWRHSLRANL